jgi:hypothetical protein
MLKDLVVQEIMVLMVDQFAIMISLTKALNIRMFMNGQVEFGKSLGDLIRPFHGGNRLGTESQSAAPDLTEFWMTLIASDVHSKTARIEFRKAEQGWWLDAQGVARLVVDDFLEQNIVDEVIEIGPECEADRLRDAVARLALQCDAFADIAEPSLRNVVEDLVGAVQSSELKYLRIDPIFGASVQLLARSMKWTSTPY